MADGSRNCGPWALTDEQAVARERAIEEAHVRDAIDIIERRIVPGMPLSRKLIIFAGAGFTGEKLRKYLALAIERRGHA